MRASEKSVLGLLESLYCLLTADRGKILEKLGKGISGFEVVEESLERHAFAHEHRGAAHNLGIAVNHCCYWLGHDDSCVAE
jgi:hypothetical protein